MVITTTTTCDACVWVDEREGLGSPEGWYKLMISKTAPRGAGQSKAKEVWLCPPCWQDVSDLLKKKRDRK